MQTSHWYFALGLMLIATVAAKAEIIKGVMSVTGAEMNWWGGLVRDTIARQSDVDKDSIKYDVEPGTKSYRIGVITFAAKKGKSIDLQKLQEDIRGTRLSGKTRSAVNYLDITATGTVVAGEKETFLKVSGTGEQYVLGDDPKAKPKEDIKTPYQRLKAALDKGEKITSVTGRVSGWSGVWPTVLRELAEEKDKKEPGKAAGKKPTLLVVTDFQTAKE